jgi:hypothetical protein
MIMRLIVAAIVFTSRFLPPTYRAPRPFGAEVSLMLKSSAAATAL